MTADARSSTYVPARNAQRTLAACVQAVRAQSRPPDELFIVVDPRSEDATVRIAGEQRVPVLEQTGPTLGSARNQAIQAARNDWIACCDSDVFPEPDWLDRLAGRRGLGAAGIGGATLEHTRSPFDEWRSIQMPHHWGKHPFRNPFMLVSEVLFDRKALLAVGGYRDDLNYYEDSDLCQRLRDVDHDLFYEPQALAHHHRSDDLMSVLNLRWKYSEYRQKHLLDRYAGLTAKARVNREYALNSLSRLLARSREDLAYVSFLLYFHHAAMDLKSLHSTRPLLSQELVASCDQQLQNELLSAVSRHSDRLTRRIGADLKAMIGSPEPSRSSCSGTDLPAFPHFLASTRAAADEFCAEVVGELGETIESSADYLQGVIGAGEVQRVTSPSGRKLEQILEGLPLEPLPSRSMLEAVRRRWPEVSSFQVVGSTAPGEEFKIAGSGGDEPAAAAAVVPHLESRSDPLRIFAELHTTAERLVVCYRPPAKFVPGLDILSAGDLASAAAAAGWTIDHFDTLVGTTRLILSKAAVLRL